MVAIFIFHGFPSIWWFLGSVWVCWIIGSLILIFYENYKKSRPLSEEEIRHSEGFEFYIKGMEFYEEKNFKEALTQFNTALEFGYESELSQYRADCLQYLGLYKESIEDYIKAISENPDDCNLYFCRSNSREETGDIDGAIKDLEQAIILSKVKSNLNENYFETAVKMGWPKGHTSMYEASLKSIQTDQRINQLKKRVDKLKNRNT